MNLFQVGQWFPFLLRSKAFWKSSSCFNQRRLSKWSSWFTLP